MTDDHDPTGMSHLLAGLKETGPMPTDLSDRIQASLDHERAQADRGTARVGADQDHDLDPEDEGAAFWASVDTGGPDPSRGSSRAGRWVLGIAAATVIVMGIGGAIAVRGFGGDEADTAADAQSAPSATTGGAVPAFAVIESGTNYTESSLASKARSLRADPGQAPEVSDPSSLGSLGTAAGAQDCLRRLGADDAQPVVVDLARFDDREGVLIITEPITTGAVRAWAVTTGCQPIWPEPTTLSRS